MISPDEFMQQATRLIAAPASPSEVDFRTALSRAYYSLYHQALTSIRNRHKPELVSAIETQLQRRRKFFADLPRVRRLDWTYLVDTLHVSFHQILFEVLCGLDYPKGQEFGAHRDERNIADYELEKNLNPQDCQTNIDDMRTLINSLNTI